MDVIDALRLAQNETPVALAEIVDDPRNGENSQWAGKDPVSGDRFVATGKLGESYRGGDRVFIDKMRRIVSRAPSLPIVTVWV